MRIGRQGGVPDSTAFSQRLSELKQEGSNILVVGPPDDGVHGDACRHLLGDDSATRRRLFAFTQDRNVCACSPGSLGGPDCRIVRQSDETSSEGSRHAEAVVGNERLGAFGTEIIGGIDEFEAAADGLDPAEVRLCFDSLGPLFVEHEPEQIFRLLHMVTSRVRQVDGMGHFHIRVAGDSDHVNLLEPLFDAVVELRSNDGTPEQRWHISNGDVSSDWLQL